MYDKRILIISPFRNEEHSVPHYLKSLANISYPQNLIDVCWFENDSSDDTYKLLFNYIQPGGLRDFNYFSLEHLTIMGKIEKSKTFTYYKDIPYGKNRIKPWLVIWNEYFIPTILKSRCDYVLIWFADCVAPPNVIEEYLKVYEQYPDCGWVGGEMWRRHPRERECISPWQYGNKVPKEITKVPFASSHCWLSKKEYFEDVEFRYHKADMHISIIEQFKEKGLYVYFQPSVKLKHVSNDGKIYK